MNRVETSKVLDLIRAHYWQTLKAGENDRAMQLETWTMALRDVPLTPYIENALEWWFRNEEWPPQASQLRERAVVAGFVGGVDPVLMERLHREAKALGARDEDRVETH